MHLDLPVPTPLDADLQWLSLLDQLYALVETEGGNAALAGVLDEWPKPWQPLVEQWASRIGARSVQISAPRALQSPGCEPGFLSHRRITGHVISARSTSPEGFSAAQAREFHVFCSHLHTAWALRSSLDATRASLSSLHGVIDALPTGVLVLDEHGEVVLLNRQGHEWLARTGQACLQARRLRFATQHHVFERALCAVMSDASLVQQLHLGGCDIQLKQLACTPLSVLLLIHERCEPARVREIAAAPPRLAQQLQSEYGLTEKELPLAWNLAQGMPLKQYAGLSGRSVETLRAQLKSIFRKLGAADQKSIGLILFEALHAVTLQALGTGVAALVAEHPFAERPLPSSEPTQHLPWP